MVSNSYGISHDCTGIPPVIVAKTGKGQFPPPPSPPTSSNECVTVILDTNTNRTTLVTNVDTTMRETGKFIDSSKLSPETKMEAKNQINNALKAIGGDYDVAKKKPGVSITCGSGGTGLGTQTPGATVTCGFTLSWPAG